ncbi:MAG TPA: anti-sigma factor [Dehalococcoidia bacterium]|nr:anti-sigma factor [Dehalococcoidia bacterium]
MTLEPLTMTCQEVDELAGAFALGALPAGEHEAVEEHLASCRRSDHMELRHLSETAALLPLLVPAAEPPANLGARIVAAALAERAAPSAGAAAEAVSAIVPFRARRPTAFPLALAAAVALVAIGLGAWGIAQRSALLAAREQEQRQSTVLALIGSSGTVLQTPGSATVPTALLVEPKAGGAAYLVQSWPPLDASRTYQAWYIAQGAQPVSAGVFSGSSGQLQAVQLAAPAQAAQAFAVTIEPAGGSAQPTSQPLFVRALTPG